MTPVPCGDVITSTNILLWGVLCIFGVYCASVGCIVHLLGCTVQLWGVPCICGLYYTSFGVYCAPVECTVHVWGGLWICGTFCASVECTVHMWGVKYITVQLFNLCPWSVQVPGQKYLKHAWFLVNKQFQQKRGALYQYLLLLLFLLLFKVPLKTVSHLPMNICTSWGPASFKKVDFVWAAHALASKVFPVPGGP